MASLIFSEKVYFFQVQKNIKKRQYNTQYCQPALKFPVFIKKDIYSGYADQSNRENKYPQIVGCSQILESGQLTSFYDVSTIE